MRIVKRLLPHLMCGLLMTTLAACGGGGNDSGSGIGSGSSSSAPMGYVPMIISDDSAQDWAVIGVKVARIDLMPQGSGAAVTVYAPATPTSINLAQLDQIGELLGNVAVPAGTYTSAALTLSANPGDVTLTASADPETGFAGTAGATVPSDQILIQHATGSVGNRITSTSVKFETPLVVTAGQTSNALDIEFDLNHPVFIVAHVPPSGNGNTLWAVNFNGPVRHHRIHDITRLVLRHMYGTVTGVATDNSAITITRQLPTVPAVSPQTGASTGQSLQILADATNGTLYYDVDAKAAPVTLMIFSSIASTINGKQVRIAARYQQNGTLVATRIWASSSFDSLWRSPEGHVLHVNTNTNVIDVANESGSLVSLTVNANTKFYFREPQNALDDATPIGTGTSFLANNNIVRGFKIHASVVDPLATPLVAQSVDIETAAFDGRVSNANTMGFDYTHQYLNAADNYSITLPYLNIATANGKDANGNTINGFKWWNFAFPTVVDSGTNAINDFVSATSGSVNFGGTAGTLKSYGVSYAKWGDAANLQGWSAPWTVLLPSPLPLGTVANGVVNNTGASSFTMNVFGGTNAATINLSTVSGSASLVYQVDRTGLVLSVSPVDITTTAGLNTLTTELVNGVPVKAFGVPQADGTVKAYVLIYYTGAVKPTM
ncbi:MAG TPA: DUF4382 domain-containing protein [Steroidobacteraceae bacterium]|nr:DUF4382 domain-containing protein [Steroidobacteraceae bacterium]